MESEKTGKFLRAVAVSAALAVLAAAPRGAIADEAKERELEARIQELEKLVRELAAQQAAGAAPVAQQSTPAPGAQPGAAPSKPATPAIQGASIVPAALANTRFSFGGYVKLDTLWTKYDDGEIADGSVGRDFYLPSAIPIGAPSESADLDSHIKQTRISFGTDTDLANGEKLIARLELDMYGSALGDERATNWYSPLIRHAYVQYQNWLVGQTWSNFQDAASLPETADFIGPTDGTIFVRQPQVRYSRGNWSVSLENPETTLTPFSGGTRISSDDNNVPDLVAAYNFKLANGYIRLAGLARQLKYQTTGTAAIDDSSFDAALSVAGKINVGKADDIRFSLTSGDAIGRYVGVNFTNDAVLSSTGTLESISGWAGYVAYRHIWNDKLRTNLMYSASGYDNDIAFTGLAANKGSRSWAINAFYSPFAKLDVGLELRHALREIESGAEGTMKRIQGVVKYSF
jgi:hypothetical protein